MSPTHSSPAPLRRRDGVISNSRAVASRQTAETPEQLEVRLLKVIARARFQVYPTPHCFDALLPHRAPSARAVACVRDGNAWSQLVPSTSLTDRDGGFALFSFHFDETLDASGFVGWLASHLKQAVGTGVIVICGRDRRRSASLQQASQGVFDYWGCPARLRETVVAEIQTLRRRGRRLPSTPTRRTRAGAHRRNR
jgi:hypothetical protein